MKKKRILGVSLTAAMVAGGHAAVAAPATSQSDSTYSASTTSVDQAGRDYFAALLFAHGPATDVVEETFNDDVYSEYVHAAAEHEDEVAQTVEVVTGLVEEQDPTFFSRFAEGLESGDVFEVEAAVAEAGEVAEAIANDVPKKEGGAAVGAEPFPAAPIFVWGVVIWDAIAVVNYAGVV